MLKNIAWCAMKKFFNCLKKIFNVFHYKKMLKHCPYSFLLSLSTWCYSRCTLIKNKLILTYVKGYLRCKMITPQNLSSEAQVKSFFISWKTYVPFSRYSSFCISNHSMIYQMSWVLVHETGCIFEYIFWTTTY